MDGSLRQLNLISIIICNWQLEFGITFIIKFSQNCLRLLTKNLKRNYNLSVND